MFENEEKRFFKDPLDFIMLLLGLHHKKILRVYVVCAVFCSIYTQGMNIAAICILQKKLIPNYISIALFVQPVFVASIATLNFSNKYLENIRSTFNDYWAIDCAGEVLEKKILRECNYLKIFAVLFVAMSVTGHLTGVLPLVGDEEDINPVLVVMKIIYPTWSMPIVLIIYYVVAIINGCTLCYPILHGVCVICHMNFQLDLLNEHLLKISDDYLWETDDDFKLLSDKIYQEIIRQRLKICVIHHITLRRLTALYVKGSRMSMLLIPVGSVVPVAACYFILYEISPRSNFRMVMILILFTLAIVSLCVVGQKFNDKDEKVFQLASKCPWHYWDNQNRRTLLIFLTAATRPLIFSSYATVQINFQLLLTIQKWIYTLVTLMY
nr:odorant receptor [Semanotus bifasciatus]